MNRIRTVTILGCLGYLLFVPKLMATAEDYVKPLANLKTTAARWALFSLNADKLIGMPEKHLIELFGSTARSSRELKEEHSYEWFLQEGASVRENKSFCDRIDLQVIVRNEHVVQVKILSLTAFH